jgi:superfamily II DNA or RNA helicase
MERQASVLAPGARVLVRDAEWLVRRVDRTSTGGQALSVVGISELVRDKESIFLTEIEKAIEVLDPADTQLVADTSSAYQASLLYMESLLRQTPPTDDNLYLGHRAAMDLVPYQLDPALQALQQPRQRILIADAVGLGKTLEAGILLSELIRRGRGKRILVATVKSMLTQFQKEMWSRFTIPLTRLDSVGIQRLRSRIPTNHNPFYYYDKAIISIDTLKQDAEYRTYLENAYWDIIVIDEAHNVAERGAGSSLRSRLAKLLARKSDTLIMLSATPHDGRARSFASLMNMLDPTAIANPDDYQPEDIKGLFIRRFKKDIQSQVERAFKEREISVARCVASPAEEAAFDTFAHVRFTQLDKGRSAGELFKTTLEKALFSSPAACLATINNRIKRLTKAEEPAYAEDIHALEDLAGYVERIAPQDFSKYQKLLTVIRDPQLGFGWTGQDTRDRLVIFTERIETLNFLAANLPRDLGLAKEQVEILHGTLPDIDQNRIVEDFGREEAPLRLLLASDVAAEGINLHFLSHRMIHFDIPWSLMIFQQRNGRIDRYGQEQTPQIAYLVTESQNAKIRGDTRILELLVQKDEQAVKNIGDPSALMGVYDIEEEEKITARAIEQGQSAEEFNAFLEKQAFDPLALIMSAGASPVGQEAEAKTKTMPSLFRDDFIYLQAAMQHLRQTLPFQVEFFPEEQQVTFTAPEDLKHRFRFLPNEVWPEDDVFLLSARRNIIQDEIKRSRKEEKAWPRVHYLWPLHPVLEWVNDKVLAAFGRHQAPVLTLREVLAPAEVVFIVSGLIPNRKAHPLVHRWFGVRFINGQFDRIEDFESVCGRTRLGQQRFPNPSAAINVEALKRLLPEAVSQAQRWMHEQRQQFEDRINEKLNAQLIALERLRAKQYQQLELRFADTQQLATIVQGRKERERRTIDQIFDDYLEWVQDTMTTEDHPYIQVVAVLKGGD